MPIPTPYTQPVPPSSRRHASPYTSPRDAPSRPDNHASSGHVPPHKQIFSMLPGSVPLDTTAPSETRQQLIDRVKRQHREQRPPWLEAPHDADETPAPATPSPGRNANLKLLPSPPLDEGVANDSQEYRVRHSELASSIERPRSALHAGDFHRQSSESRGETARNESRQTPIPGQVENQWLGSSPPAPWLARKSISVAVPASRHSLDVFCAAEPFLTPAPIPSSLRSRASSQSSSSFVFRPPTSPLANQSNSADLDALEDYHVARKRSRSPDKSSRRRTFSPSALRTLNGSPAGSNQHQPHGRPLPNLRRQGSFPYQAHQPRRSMTSFSESLSFGTLDTPSAHGRRPSATSDASPLQQLPMVGRYEESILRGRMSSLPSKPVEFVAQIGVLGKGSCKASLRCPAHVTVPFPAVFYNYGSKPGLSSHEGPSPYVGRIDLDKDLKRDARKPRRKHAKPDATPEGDAMEVDEPQSNTARTRRTMPQTGESNRDVPRGTYRIPAQGQIQVIVKNPNKTAVKLFLIPYDVHEMQPGQKTWIRQRSYAAAANVEHALSSKPRSEAAGIPEAQDRPMLRYLIHLHVCCLSKGQYYLYKEIRVVFANRVPDGKEKLRQEISLPEPRFSTYRRERRDSGEEARATQGLSDGFVEERRAKAPAPATAAGSQTSGDGRPNFAWESFAPAAAPGPAFMPLASMAFSGMPRAHPERCAPDVEMMDSAPMSTGAPSRPASPGSRSDSRNTPSPGFNAHFFERLSREQWSPSGAPPRVLSPAPGEGLIAQQHRTWGERLGSSDEGS